MLLKTILIGLQVLLIGWQGFAQQLERVYTGRESWNGVAVSKDGRVFINFPRLEGGPGSSIAEILRGNKIVPYPDANWNSWQIGEPASNKFVRTNSLRIASDGKLWVVDTGAPTMGQAPLPDGAAKLVIIDLKSNKVVRTISLEKVSAPNSFINDLRMYGDSIYLTDAGEPALIVMSARTGQGRRILENHQSTTDTKPLRAEGVELKDDQGNPVKVHADHLEISPDGKWLYYQALSGPLWRIETRYLTSSAAAAANTKLFYETPSTGGTAMDAAGNLYVSDIDSQQIIKITPAGQSSILLKDKRLLWADALWIDDAGYLWIPCAQINRLAPFQQGKDRRILPVVLYKLKINVKPFRS